MAKANATPSATSSAYPGPWLVQNHNEIVVDDENETLIAEVFDENRCWQANARLIAAAPLLLDACKTALADAHMALRGHRSNEGFQAQIDWLETVIAQAERG